MTSMRVNADYESVLFHGKAAPSINQALEFFLFFLSDAPLNSSKKYDPSYLNYVASITGRQPQVVNEKESLNWWGPLQDLDQERWWNSKVTSQKLNPDSFMVNGEADLLNIKPGMQYLLKDPFGMSGQRIQLFDPALKLQLKYPLLAEPFFDRVLDFSHYIFPNGKMIAYENLVDRRFQYKGTVFSCLAKPELKSLSFYSQISQEKWHQFALDCQQVRNFYAQQSNLAGYSIDSFTYRDRGEIKIRAFSEVNYRRTMGRCAYELGVKQNVADWFGFFILKPGNKPLWKIAELKGLATVLSPGDSRFEMLTVSAPDQAAAKEKIKWINELLTHTQTAIDF